MIDTNTDSGDLTEVLHPGRIRYKPYKTTAQSKQITLDEENYSKEITYRIQLPDENHTQNHAPTILYNRESINEFKQFVRSTNMRMQECTQMIDTKDLMVAIFSMQIISYRLPFPGKNMEELIKIHKNKKSIIKYIHCDDDYNTCFWYNLTCTTKPDSKGIEIDRYSRIAEGKRLLFEFYSVKKENQHEFLKNYLGFTQDDSLKVCQKYNININCYEYDDKNVEVPYNLFTNYSIDNQQAKNYNILLLNDDDGNQHLMYIISVVRLLGIKICPICINHAVFTKDPNNNSKRKMDTHMKECQKNNGLIKKYVTLEKFPKLFISRITSNKTYRCLIAQNREAEYKPTQYYITFRFQTELQKVSGRNYPILNPTAVASTFKAKNYIKTVSYDNWQEDFVEKWVDQVFSEALQIRSDNKFSDEVPQRYEVPIIGFDCLKSAATLIFMNLKSNKYEIINRPGPRSCPIHIKVKSTENSIHLKFIDAKNYVSANMELDDFLRDIGKVEPCESLIKES
ncbi:MAG: hypothetical protein EZS28_013322 [Streblomastix strix]|uniref:Uncharacterized protein n=1 Tax=Streblomastix strix TaxID=222440 RepID=A0A5J4W8C9_9EUKA|nr:MAG: hypothetical protein EZS28_013322 [Streblomastix strix]